MEPITNVQILLVIASALGILALCGAFYALGWLRGRGEVE